MNIFDRIERQATERLQRDAGEEFTYDGASYRGVFTPAVVDQALAIMGGQANRQDYTLVASLAQFPTRPRLNTRLHWDGADWLIKQDANQRSRADITLTITRA